MKFYVLVDLQNDFFDGALGSAEAQAIIPAVVKRIGEFEDGSVVILTQDTHSDNYLNTLEGKKLPIPHCIKGTPGHCINAEVDAALMKIKERVYLKWVPKYTFGSNDLPQFIHSFAAHEKELTGVETDGMEIELFGLVTNICVVSNALLLRASFPNAKITVNSACCAGTTPEAHKAALMIMQSCQIDVI